MTIRHRLRICALLAGLAPLAAAQQPAAGQARLPEPDLWRTNLRRC